MSRFFTVVLVFPLFVLSAALAQSVGPAASPTNSVNPAPNIHATLQDIERTAQSAALDITRLRIEKWKTDSSVKDQAQANADSLERNMTAALPALTSAVRAAPQDLAANFKLYRNLNALYDVFEGLTESAGAFGPKQDFESLSQHVMALDAYRRSFGDYLEQLAASKDAELVRLRTATQRPVQAPPPKKIIVDNDLTPTKSKKKR
jgi:hypothetical protein